MRKITLFFLLINLMISCSTHKYLPEIKDILIRSGDNRNEFLKTIDYFQQKGDTLQLDALYFLLRNMEGHSYYTIALHDSTGTEIPFNVLDHENYDLMIMYLDSLEATKGELHWKLKDQYNDLETMKSEVLIENIELAFQAWREFPWSQDYDYDIFLEYILPYRGSNEPIESWRPYFMNTFSHITRNESLSSDPLQIAAQINREARELFGFDSRFYCNPTDQGITEMLENKLGRCEDMTNFIIYALRANGIPVTSDYTPHWANSGNNHAWNAVVTPEGQAIPFMGCEADPGEYQLSAKLGKAYRKTFAEQKDNLGCRIKEGEEVPAWLRSKYYTDVTTLYTQVANVPLLIERDIPDSTRFIFLCVFNSGEWQAIHWSEIVDGKAEFSDMGTDVCYLPMFYYHKELIPAGDAFILDKNCSIKVLSGESIIPEMSLLSVTKKTISGSTENRKISYLQQGKEYELFFWHNEWQSLGCQTASEDPLIFRDVPANRLYWLVEKGSKKEERIFTYSNEQVWW
ncbi:MAG: transglutaminase domain-containing protein [Candidatus Cloacimonetes bacterium]|nr:transglutaminase domain-containing protein [Candidatus Cloacimonadota bacterium]